MTASTSSFSLNNNVFIKSTSGGKQVQCSVCECWLPSSGEEFVKSHLSGRKHKQQVERRKEKERKLRRSIFVKGFDPLLPDLEHQLLVYFEGLGVNVVDVYVDKNSTLYAIIELTDSENVNLILNCQKPVFHGMKLVIRRREVQSNIAISETISETQPSSVSIDSCELQTELQNVMSKETDVCKQMDQLVEFCKLTENELELRKLLCQLLKNVFEEIYSDCEVHLFGSSVNGLGQHGCDVDLTLTTKEAEESDKLFSDLREVVQRFAPGCKNVSIVHSPKTCSVIKFLHTQSNLSVDLSLNNHLALTNTHLIKTYLEYDRRVPLVVFTIRKWAKSFGFLGRTSREITSYAWTLMAIHYLQQLKPLPLLPCFQECHECEEKMVGEWNCAYCSSCSGAQPGCGDQSSPDTLLWGFFNFYREFDYKTKVICIHTASPFSRAQACADINRLQIGDAENDYKFSSSLVVQDPFKRTHNLTHNLSSDGLAALGNAFKRVTSLCDELTLQRISLLDFFTIKKCTKREKQRQKRNRSNSYTISLPNCQHSCSSSHHMCYDVVRNMLEVKLRMRITDETVEDEISGEKSGRMLEYISVKTSTVPLTAGSEKAVESLKRSADSAILTNHAINTKRIKISSAKSVNFVVSAYAETWTNRRKERRLVEKLQTQQEEEKEKEDIVADLLEKHEDTDSGILMSEINDTNSSSNRRTDNEPVLHFKASMTKASVIKEVCKLKLEPLDGSSNMTQFQTFYAFVKKELIITFK